jgi:alpha,alpha-trehalase
MGDVRATRSPRLESLRLVSDGRSAALVGPDAALHWWCWPRFDSPPLCWSLLDPRGGAARWLDAVHAGSDGDPAGPTTRTRLHVGFSARVEVWDGLVATDDGGTDLIRLVRALDGPVEIRHSLALGGFFQPWATWTGNRAEFDRLPAISVSGGSTTSDPSGSALTQLCVEPSRWSALLIGREHHDAPDAEELAERLRASERARDRTAPRRVSRTHAERIQHSLAVLAACTDRETGAVVAAPTTSLPEVVDGNRQFDYRYSWLRDSSVAIAAASLVGNHELAEEYVRFLTELGTDRLLETPMRTVDGALVPEEREVPGIAGWSGSRPVRIGNDASTQLQYDVLGFVADAMFTLRRTRGRLDRDLRAIVRLLADRAAEPREPSNGIWEMRERADVVSGDIGRWLALDRALRLTSVLTRPGARRRWRRARDDARARVLGALLDDGSLPQVYGSDDVDASGLLLVVFELLRASDPRAERLVSATIAALGAGPLLYRYPPDGRDGFDAGEGPFVPASWWAVTALAKIGHPDAQARADELCHMLPALQPEGFDPGRREALGNMPLLWSHAECTRALFELDRQRRLVKRVRRRVARAMSRRSARQ